MRSLLVALVLIRAVLPVSEDVKARAEELRQVAINAGCADPRLVMYAEGKGTIDVEITCREGSDGR